MKKKLTITISGEANSGKSSLTYYLKELLKWHDFDIEFKGNLDFKDEAAFDGHFREVYKDVIKEIFKDRKIIIEEEQTPYNVNKRKERKEKMVNYLLRVQNALGTGDKDMAEKQAEYFLKNEEYLRSQDYNKVSTIYQLSLIH